MRQLDLRLSRWAAIVALVLFALMGGATASRAEVGVGVAAPAVTVKEWVKGAPVTRFESGKIYVVEFWATWCGPCKVSIPHLTALAKKYPNVQFVGVSVWETNQNLVKPFVTEKGDQMAYTVAMDEVPDGAKGGEGAMAKGWMQAAGQNGIPTAFIVNGDGKIAWIGHPLAMDKPLAAITAGTWDINKAATDAAAANEAERKRTEMIRSLQGAVQAKKYTEAIAIIDQAVVADPTIEGQFAPTRFNLLLQAKQFDAAVQYGAKLQAGLYARDATGLNNLAWTIVDPDHPVASTPALHKFAVKAAQKAVALVKGKPEEEAGFGDTLAAALYANGDVKGAYATQKRAVALAQGTPTAGDKSMVQRLEKYRTKVAAKP